MYNRYIPQADGSYQRNRMEDTQASKPPKKPADHTPPPEVPTHTPPPRKMVSQPPPPMGVGNFLRQLLPKEFDTADLLIILLLLLMAGDNEEEKSNALLTMALYFLM